MYASSPSWRADWISKEDLERVLTQLSDKVLPSPLGAHRVSINYGLHFTGGEPFLNFDLLLEATVMAHELGIPSTFVETNSFWCTDEGVREKLMQLKDSGLDGILVSVNPFILEQVPFERTERAIGISGEIFKENLMVYQEIFYHQFRELKIKSTLTFEEYLRRVGLDGLRYVELLPMGRATYRLEGLYRKYPAVHFFSESCIEELMRRWHVHIDNYGSYITGYCGGISLGDARDLDSICNGIDLEERPILNSLLTNLEELYKLAVKEFDYKERKGGFISKCHLCLDIRKHIAGLTDEFEELRPMELYLHLQ